MTETPAPNGRRQDPGIALLITLLGWLSVLVAARLMYQPPPPAAVDAPAQGFSAMRADKYLQALVEDGVPHPAGSEQNRIVRNRIVDFLGSFGYAVLTQQTQSILEFPRTENDPDTVPIVNVLARSEGSSDEGAVLLVAHYDSVPFGPGASDDGVAVAAVLEIARMLQASAGKRKRDVMFLITDGEEYGLLGAKRFVAEHPWAKEVEFVVNLEARGTTGPSLMFQTSQDSEFLIQVFARSAKRPMASSLFYEIYRRMPNDTDFTVFREYGMRGFNLAFIGDVRNYHTENDNYQNADRGSLQHHGENALGLVLALSDLPAAVASPRRAVYFDFMGRWLFFWPEQFSAAVSIAMSILFVIALMVHRGRAQYRFRSLSITIGLVAIYFTLVVAVGCFIDFCLRLDGRLGFPWPAEPLAICATFWFSMLAITCGSSTLAKPTQQPEIAWFAVWTYWIMLSLLSSVYFSGGSYLFIVPATAACVSIFIWAFLKRSTLGFFASLSAIVAGLVWLPPEQLFYDAVGFKMNLVMVMRSALLGTTLLPVLATTGQKTRSWLSLGFLAATIVSLLAAVLLNPPEI